MSRKSRRILFPALIVSSILLVMLGISPSHGQNIPSADEYRKSGKFDKHWGDGIPLAVDTVVMQRGKNLYTANCSVCHGAMGISPTPTTPSLLDAAPRDLPDGQVFWIITNGQKTMNGFRSILSEDDRWKIVCYIRALQLSQSDSPIPLPSAMTQEIDAIKKKQPPAPISALK